MTYANYYKTRDFKISGDLFVSSPGPSRIDRSALVTGQVCAGHQKGIEAHDTFTYALNTYCILLCP